MFRDVDRKFFESQVHKSFENPNYSLRMDKLPISEENKIPTIQSKPPSSCVLFTWLYLVVKVELWAKAQYFLQDCMLAQWRLRSPCTKFSLSAWRRFKSLATLRVPCNDSDQTRRTFYLVGNAVHKLNSAPMLFFKLLLRIIGVNRD